MENDNTLLWPWLPTPEDEQYRLAYDLINHINYLLQEVVREQKHVNEILHNSSQPAADILLAMGTNGEKWMKAYNIVNTCVESLATLTSKTLEDISADAITTTTKDIEIGVGGTVKIKALQITNKEITVSGIINQPFKFVVTAAGQYPYRFSATKLPDGLTIDIKSGLISGEPKKDGEFNAILVVQNDIPEEASYNLLFTISAK